MCEADHAGLVRFQGFEVATYGQPFRPALGESGLVLCRHLVVFLSTGRHGCEDIADSSGL